MDDLNFKHVATWAGSIIVPVLLGWIVWISSRVTNMYTKGETENVVSLMNEPLKQAIENSNRINERLVHALDRLEDLLSDTRVDVAVLKQRNR